MRMGGNVPPVNFGIITNNKQQKTMKKVRNVFPIAKVETNEKIIDLASDRGQIYCRVAIHPNGDDDELSEEDKKLFAKLSEKAKQTTKNGELNGEISNVFPVSVFSPFVEGLEEIATSEEYFAEDAQKDVISQIAELIKNELFIFTYYTESIANLLKDTQYEGISVLYAEKDDGTIKAVGSRNNLYFGRFDDEENAYSFMQSRLLDAIENEDLLTEKPNSEQPKTETPAKPKLTLRK